ncbi:uncharacterized protein [Linepithema humile]|uniref:uncharacterized protein n=1 Tax=Linepithema humile TaxID=83485 RepID=UPI0006231C86|nr:PREDICTED: probable cytosolic oligopeptidase A [Linepithema humile]
MAVSFCGRRIISTQRNFLKIPKRHGYIVLLPEIGEESTEKNPLLKDDNLPEFNTFTIEKCIAAIGRQTVDLEEKIKNLERELETKKNLDVLNDWLHPIEETYLPLETTWGIAKTLYFSNQSLMPTKYYMSIHERATRAIASKFGSAPLFRACKEALDNDIKLTHLQKRLLTKYVLEGTLNGLHLQEKELEKYMDDLNVILLKIKEYKSKYEGSTRVYNMTIQSKEVIEDFPKDFLKSIAADPRQPYAGPWTINLKPYILTPFMEYCPDRELRAAVWDADVTRCSIYQERSVQASVTLEELRSKRIEQAQRLGYKNFAEMSMETKMAGNLENLMNMLETLRSTALPAQEQEIASLTEFAKERGFDGDKLRIWDVPYWGRKQCRSIYNCDESEWRSYFPLPTVLSGLFEHIETLFNVKIVESKKADIWHRDVRFFDIFDLNGSSAEPIANFYLDPYARDSEKFRKEQNSGWVSTIKSKSKIDNSTPLIALIFNFPPPVGDKPSLLSFKDVQILFQKFGHALQNLLTTVEYSDVGGLSFVEWDAVFICDFFMENWLYEPFVLQKISQHYETKQPLSAETMESIKKMRSHLAGYKLCKELYLSHLDLELHSSNTFWVPMMKKLWPQYFMLPLEKRDVHVCSFEAIWSGNWAAAYFSKIWSQMIAADLYTAFQEIQSDNKSHQKEMGARFRNTFLSLGGSYPAAEVFRKFRGRDPSPQALLDNLELTQTKKAK